MNNNDLHFTYLHFHLRFNDWFSQTPRRTTTSRHPRVTTATKATTTTSTTWRSGFLPTLRHAVPNGTWTTPSSSQTSQSTIWQCQFEKVKNPKDSLSCHLINILFEERSSQAVLSPPLVHNFSLMFCVFKCFTFFYISIQSKVSSPPLIKRFYFSILKW